MVVLSQVCFTTVANTDYNSVLAGTKQPLKSQPKVQPEMVVVKGGTLLLGYVNDTKGEIPSLEVKVNSFLIGKYEVTQWEWETIMEVNYSTNIGEMNPVDYVASDEIFDFCNLLSVENGLKPVYSHKVYSKSIHTKVPEDSYSNETLMELIIDTLANGYRLPTEDEWEFAAKGGTSGLNTKFAGSNILDSVGWFSGNSKGYSHSVGQKKPNELGIYDMTGNLWEQCLNLNERHLLERTTIDKKDVYSDYQRIFRGGSFSDSLENCHLRSRYFLKSENNKMNIGFRLARSLK